MRLRMLATRMVSRVRVTSNGLDLPSRIRVRVSLVPGAPRSGSMPSLTLIGLPSMATMVSPALIPARSAGVPSIGEITLSVLSGCCISSTPTPS